MEDNNVTGPEFKQLRVVLGYTAWDIVDMFQDLTSKITSDRGIYHLERSKKTVPVKYLMKIEKEVGRERYRYALRSARETINRRRGGAAQGS